MGCLLMPILKWETITQNKRKSSIFLFTKFKYSTENLIWSYNSSNLRCNWNVTSLFFLAANFDSGTMVTEISPAPVSFYNFTEILSSCTHMQKHGQLSGMCQFKLLLKIPKFTIQTYYENYIMHHLMERR